MTTNRINFANVAQAAMFEHEFLGQFSDGAWENAPGERWKTWCPVEVAVDADNVGRNFHAYDRYNLARADLLDVIEQRLLGIARVALKWGSKAAGLVEGILFDVDGWLGLPKHTGDYWTEKRSEIALWLDEAGATLADVERVVTDDGYYTPKHLRVDLRQMKQIMRVVMMPAPEPTPAPEPKTVTATYREGDRVQNLANPLFDEGYVVAIKQTPGGLTVLVLGETPDAEEIIEIVLPRVVR